tara:strand:- start:851 stop:1084 length:234 start_codon:yes stop_codon:yes gene_type:complete
MLDQLTEEQVEHLFKKLDDIETVFRQEEEVRYQGDPIPATTVWAFSILYQLVYDLWNDTIKRRSRKNLDEEVEYGKP